MSGPDRESVHVPEGEILAWSDGELPVGARARVGRHLEACGACGRALAALRDDGEVVRGLLRLVDVAPPPRRPPAAAALAKAPVPRVRRLAAAAVLVLLLSGLAAALVPGSPLRAWWEERTPWVPKAGPPASAGEVAHLSVLAPERVDVVLPAGGDALEVRVTVWDEAWLQVRTAEDAPPARLELIGERLVVDPGAVRGLHVVAPAAVRVRVLSGGRVLLRRAPGDQDATGGAAWRDTTVAVGPAPAGR